ncbi:MAG: hypothetical protein J0M19_06170, partial [Sphingomonadales bacterium]|nr:hypothetical protein [Sphingomonadales bacterium]
SSTRAARARCAVFWISEAIDGGASLAIPAANAYTVLVHVTDEEGGSPPGSVKRSCRSSGHLYKPYGVPCVLRSHLITLQ